MEEEFNSIEDIEKIEMYFEDKMSPEEKAIFETRLTYDSALREELELYKNIVEGIKHSGRKNQKEKLRQLDKEIDGAEVFSKKLDKRKKNKIIFYRIAASFFVLTTLTFYFFRHNSGNIEKYEEEDIGLPVLMSSAGNIEFNKGMNFYKQRQFDSAINIFKTMNPNDTLDYYIGVSEYGLKEYAQAKNYFSMVTTYSSSTFKAKAEYQLGLCFWHMGEMKGAKVQFEAVANDKSTAYSDRAKEILKELTP